MGKYISLDEAKKQCNIDLEYTGDDDLITDIILDVEDISASDLCIPLADLEVDDKLPRTIIRAMLLLIASYYKNRENEVNNGESAQLENGYRRLISNYRKYDG